MDQVAVPLAWTAFLLLIARVARARPSRRMVALAVGSAVAAWGLRVELTDLAVGAQHNDAGLGLPTAVFWQVVTGLGRNWVSFSCIAVLAWTWAITLRTASRYSSHVACSGRLITFVCVWVVLAGVRRFLESLDPVGWLTVPILAYLVIVVPRSNLAPGVVRGLRASAFAACSALCVFGALSFGYFEVTPRVRQDYAWVQTSFGAMYTPQTSIDELTQLRQLEESSMPRDTPFLSVPYEGVNYVLGSRNPTRLVAVQEIASTSRGLAIELHDLPPTAWLVIDCDRVECGPELVRLEDVTHRQWDIVRMPDVLTRPAFLVARPSAALN